MSEKPKSLVSEINANANDMDVPWLEWKDFDLNNEKWGVSRDGPDGLFLDTERVVMPRSLEPYQWIRAKDLKHLTDSLTVYTMTTGHPDLVANNKHLLNSEFVRWFISALTNLQYCGREGLEISGENTNFIWVNRYNSWHGWMHVYSLNKAGKGAQHRPVINPNGKYIVRLYYMGCWRRILVDDIIPIDKDGKPLLPCTSNNFELWPMLLAKALLKVASHTWTEHREIVDFHPIACLTGWTCLTLTVKHLSSQDKWDLLTKYSERFEWTPQTTISEKKNITEEPKETLQSFAETEKSQPITLFFLLSDIRELGSDVISGLSPCWDHVIHIVQSRDVPLDPKDVKEPLAQWKLHRWLKWAISQNVIDPADYFMPIRYVKVISPLKECDDSVTRDYNKYNVKEKSVSPKLNQQTTKSAWKPKSQNISDPLITTKAKTVEDISEWIDFNKLALYIMEVHLFYKLEYFQCSIQVIGDVVRALNENRNASIAKETKKEKRDSYSWFSQTPKSKMKPLYLLCDSLERKFFLINLCTAPKKTNSNSSRSDYLILEKYNCFFELSRIDQSITISTTGSKSTILELEAGRQLLRIYRGSESSLMVISSDTAFYLGNRAAVQQIMMTESERVKEMSKKISNNLRAAYQSFGTKDYSVMLKNYYQSYMPTLQEESLGIDKDIRILIHHSFMEEQIRLIKEAFPEEELENILHALRVFFLSADIRLEYFNLVTDRKSSQDSTAAETSEDISGYTREATIIQSFLKMARVKGYKDLHNPDHSLHAQICKELEKISDLFDSSLASQLLRNVINRHRSLRDLYHCSKDFAHVLNIQEFNGVLKNARHEQWFPIARLVMNPKPAETVLAVFELLVDLPRVALRVFSNQNQLEVPRIVNHVAPVRYKHLPSGYTIFAYGRSEKQHFKELDWAIRVITIKGESTFYQLDEQQCLSLQSKPSNLTVEELYGTYVPNVKNCIARWILRAVPGTIVSIRLATSYSLVEIEMRIIDEEGNILADTKGDCTILLPVMILKPIKHREIKERHQDADEESRNIIQEEFVIREKSSYYIEAFVLNDSWPLTDAEWTVVNEEKLKLRRNLETKVQAGNKVSSNLLRKDLRQFTNDDKALESPYWVLQLVADTQDSVEICQDRKREEEMMSLKEYWWSKAPDRYERGRELREAFLNTHVSKIVPEASSRQNGRQSRIMEDEDMLFCLPKQRRTLKPPESRYLLPLDLTKYTRGNEVAKYRVKTKNDDEILKNQHIVNIADSQRNYSNYLDKLIELMNERLQRYAKFFRKRKEDLRKKMMLTDAAYESRKIYVDSLASDRAKTKEKQKTKD